MTTTVTVADPLATAVTNPVLLTVAMLVSSDDHVRVGSATSEPPESRTNATTVVVSPGPARMIESVDNVVEAGICRIVTEAVPIAEPEVAVMLAVPPATAVTVPEDETLAMDDAEDVHVTGTLPIVAPFWSQIDRISCCVSPNQEKLTVAGVIVTVVATDF